MSEQERNRAYNLEDVVSERNLAEALGVTVPSLRATRYKLGLSAMHIGRAVFYHGPTFVRELLRHGKAENERPSEDIERG